MSCLTLLLACASLTMAHLPPYQPRSSSPFTDHPATTTSAKELKLLVGNVDHFLQHIFQKSYHIQKWDGEAFHEDIFPLSSVTHLLQTGVHLCEQADIQICPTASKHDLVECFDVNEVPMINGKDLKLSKRVQLESGEYWSGMIPFQTIQPDMITRAIIEKGFTLIVNSVERRSFRVAQLAESIMTYLAAFPISTNLYMTPKHSQGFEAHADWMDVIIMQLHGAKHWMLYPDAWELRNPFSDMIIKPSEAILNSVKAKEVTISPGDVLYIPAGCIHEASTVPTETMSLHLTFGIEIEPIDTWAGLIILAVSNAPSGHIPMPSIPIGAIYQLSTRLEFNGLRRAIPFGDWMAGYETGVFDYFKRIVGVISVECDILSVDAIIMSGIHPQLRACLKPWPPVCDSHSSCLDSLHAGLEYLVTIEKPQFVELMSTYMKQHRNRMTRRQRRQRRDLDRADERLE